MHFYEAAEADPRYGYCSITYYLISEGMIWVIFGLVFVLIILCCVPLVFQVTSFQIGLSGNKSSRAQIYVIASFDFLATLTFCIGWYWIESLENYSHIFAWFLIGFVGFVSLGSFFYHLRILLSNSSLIPFYASEESYQKAPSPVIPQSTERTAIPVVQQTSIVIPPEASELIYLQAERKFAIWMTVIMFLIMSASIVYMYFIFNCAWNIVLN